ncbi:MAG: hypothetical protein IJR43_00055 [Synergistaceae bacterium]|nr:hypothetical protein [Synergistaceae bacterium]MBQ9627636.1 hypothetical protein [Synergistaceae bacterium]
MPVTQERTGWRDEGISRRHRKWGVGCTAVDFDFLLIEYEFGKPCAIVEYKNEHAEPQYASDNRYKALISLGDNSKIPVIACRYSDDFTRYTVTSLNEFAKKYVPERKTFDETGYITLLYEMKGHKVTPEFFERMKVEI